MSIARCLAPSLLTISCSVIWGSFLLGADIDKPGAAAGTTPNGFRPLVTLDRLKTPLLAPASKEGEARIKQFRHVPGLKIELWAAEPMLANPVAFSVDELGRVFTSETYRYRSSVLDIRHYMFMLEDDLASLRLEDRLANIRKWFGPDGENELSQETEVVRMLEDTDQDGHADKSTVFADGLNGSLDGIASGILARHGEVWLTDIPSLWRFTTNAAVAAQSTIPASSARSKSPIGSHPRLGLANYSAAEMFRGWGVRFSFTGHDLHGLKFGPDGRLYFSVGDRGTQVVTHEGTTIDLPDEGAVFRCEPDGLRLEVFARGLRNPQELAFNEYGDLFTGDNDSDQGDRERWVHVVLGMDAGWRVGYQHAPLGNAGMWNMERLWVPYFPGQAAYIVPPLANIGDGPSGLVYDYGSTFPAGLSQRFLLAYFKGTSARSGIYSLGVRAKGASYELVAHDEFVWNSLVPDVDLGPDGSIYFADWHEGWPKSNKGRLYRAYFPEVTADPAVRATQKLIAEGMIQRGADELLGLLAHRDMRVRQEAQFELARRGPKSFAGLRQIALGSTHSLARIHAIWGLGQIGRGAPRTSLGAEFESLLPLLESPDLEVVGQTAKMLGESAVTRAATGKLQSLMLHANLRVRTLATQGLTEFLRAISHRQRDRRSATGLGESATGGTEVSGIKVGGVVIPEPPGGAFEAGAEDPTLRTAQINLATTWLEIQKARQDSTGVARSAPLDYGHSWASTNAQQRMNLLLVLRRMADPDIAKFLADPDPLIVLEAARAINDVPIIAALPSLASLGDFSKLNPLLKQLGLLNSTFPTAHAPVSGEAIRDVRFDQPMPWGTAPVDQLAPMLLRVVNANFRLGTAASAERLAGLAARTDLPEVVRMEALHGLASWAEPAPRDRIVGTYRPLPRRVSTGAQAALAKVATSLLSDSVVAAKTADTVAALGYRDAEPALLDLVKRTSAPSVARASALRALAAGIISGGSTSLINGSSKLPANLEEALSLARNDPAEALRLEASKLQAILNPGDAAGQLAILLVSGTQAEQQGAYATLGTLKSEAADALLADALDKLIKREVMPEVTLDLVEAAAKRSATAVKSRLAAYEDWKLPKDSLSPYREALVGGDVARGRKIFYENAAVACTRCHQIAGDGGGNAGPKLDGVATRNVREYLLESIVFPNQQIVPGFEAAALTLKSGDVLAGTVKAETAEEIVLLNPETGGDIRVAKAEIVTREKGLSGMPDGFGNLLSRQELRDVMEFLGTLKE